MVDQEQTPVTPEAPSSEERNWAVGAHLAALAGFIIPFGNLIGPLVVWLIKKDEMPFVNDQGREALNFQITVTLAAFVCILLILVVIGALLIWVVGIYALVMMVIAAVRANGGTHYRYPLTLRLVK